MGCSCTPLGKTMSKVLQRLRAKVTRRRSLKVHHPRCEGKMAKSAIPSNDNPICVTRPPPDLDNTSWGTLPPTAIPSSPHEFPATSQTIGVVQVRFAKQHAHDAIPAVHPSDDTEWSRHEPGFASYSYGSPVSGQGHEDGARRDYYYGEYHYYPTPVREGIYNLTADSSRLSTIFSDENPNACNIV